MLPNFIFNVWLHIRLFWLRYFGTPLDKALIEISDRYYDLLSEGKIHEEIITAIIRENYDKANRQAECRDFVFKKKFTVDNIFESKYGRSGRFMAHLFKLIQKIYLDRHFADSPDDFEKELRETNLRLNKSFRRVTLHMYAKHLG
jgi:hypothetical protein